MTNLPKITLSKLLHRAQQSIGINFDYNSDLLVIVRTLPYAKWTSTHKTWYIKNNPAHLKLIYKKFKNKAEIDGEAFFAKAPIIKQEKVVVLKPKRVLNSEQKTLLNTFYKYLKGKRYSQSTIDTYSFSLADFIAFYTNKKLETLTNRDVELYIESVYIKRNYSVSTQRQFISALKLFIVFCPITKISEIELTRPNRDRVLPTVLSQKEVIALICKCKNLKHRVIIALLYSGGLRISELINLKIESFHINRRQIFIKNSKGRKDRYVTLAESFLPLLQNYLITYTPKYYFVEGQTKQQYTASSVRKFIKKYKNQCGIIKNVTPHTLRHSYATHLLEDGVNLRHIQELLGHSKPETTMIYTHVARKDLLSIKSPLDSAVEQLKKIDKEEQNFLLSGK